MTVNDEMIMINTSLKHHYGKDVPKANYPPVSGNFGQNCVGYLQGENGKLYRIITEETEDNPGPGSYDPIYPTDKTVKRTISTSSKRDSYLSPTALYPGPGAYTISKQKKIMHQIQKSKDDKPPPPILSGNLTHKAWYEEKKSHIPKNRFPLIPFKPKTTSGPFSSTVARDLFSIKNNSDEPTPVYIVKPPEIIHDERIIPPHTDRWP